MVTFVVSLGTYDTGLSLAAQFVDTDGADVGSAVTTGWVELGDGHYMVTCEIPADHQGAILVYDQADDTVILEAGAINP